MRESVESSPFATSPQSVEMKTDKHCREGKSSVKLCQASYPVDGDLTNGECGHNIAGR